MPNEERIDSWIDTSKTGKETDEFLKQLGLVEDAFKRINSTEVKIGGASNNTGLTAALKEQLAATKDLTAGVTNLATARKNQTAADREVARAAKEEAKINAELTNSYKQLDNSVKANEERYKNLAAQLGLQHRLSQEALKDLMLIKTQRDNINRAYGNYTDNVGKYSSATAGLNNNIRILASELPNAGISLRTFTQSLSNNITPFIQSIKEVQLQNKQLKIDGQATVSVAKTLGASLLSTSVITGIAVVAGLKLVEVWQKGSKAAQEAEKATKKYNDAINSADESERSAAQQQIARLTILTKMAQDNAQSTRARTLAVEELQKTYPSTFGNLSKQTILEGDLEAAINKTTQAILDRAAAQAAEKKFAAASEKEYDLLLAQRTATEALDKAQKNYDATLKTSNNLKGDAQKSVQTALLIDEQRVRNSKQALADIIAARMRANQEALGFLKDAQDSAAKAGDVLFGSTKTGAEKSKPTTVKEDLNLELKQEIDNQKKIAESEENSYEDRYEALDKFIEKKKELYKIEGKTAEAFQNEIHLMEKEMTSKIEQDETERIERVSKKQYELLQTELNNIELRGKLANQSNEDIYQNQISYLDQTLRAMGFTAEEIKKIEDEITKYRIKQAELRNKAGEKDAKATKRQITDLINQLRQLEQATGDAIYAVFSANNDKRIKEIERRSAADDDAYNKQKDNILKSSKDEKEKAELLQVLEDEMLQKKKETDAETRQLKRRQAIADRAAALLSIISNTAAGITKELLDKGIPAGIATAAILGGIGAAQAAVVLSQPLPEYKHGRKETDSYEGAAIAGEAGTELMIDKDGKMSLLTQPTLVNVRRGDRIFSNAELKAGIVKNQMPDSLNKIEFDDLIRATAFIMDKSTNKTVKAIKGIPQTPPVSTAVIMAQLAARR